MVRYCIGLIGSLALLAPALAGPDNFTTGPVLEAYGGTASVADSRLGPDSKFKIAFDVAQAAEDGEVSRRLETAARFLNMHAAAGVPVENIQLAIVVHGGASRDLVTAEARGGENANAGLIAALIEAGVTIELCGQTAAYFDIEAGDLLPGVSMSLSAMTSHALLQQAGYTLNPF